VLELEWVVVIEPTRARPSQRIAVSTPAQMPARHQRRKWVLAADRQTVKSCDRCRHAQPVGGTYAHGIEVVTQLFGRAGRPPCGWCATLNRARRAKTVWDAPEPWRRRRRVT
jgi:hypothetical protein